MSKMNGLSINDYGGDKPALIFIHAFPLSSEMWKEQVEFFKKDFRVITYDVRGLGLSAEEDNLFTMEQYSDDFFAILDTLKIIKANVCGLSMGGYIALRSLVRDKSKFNSVVLCDTKAERDDNEGIIGRSIAIKSIKTGERKQFVDSFLNKLVWDVNQKNDNIMSFLTSIIDRNTDNGICGALNAMATRTDTTDYLKEVEIPSLIIVGEKDILIPVNFSEKMQSALMNSALKIIKRAGHLTNIENPNEFNSVLYRFLKLHN